MYNIHFVGDIMPGELPEKYGFGFASLFKKSDGFYPFEFVRETFLKSDLVMGNLE